MSLLSFLTDSTGEYKVVQDIEMSSGAAAVGKDRTNSWTALLKGV